MEGGSASKQGRGPGGECGATRRLTSQSAGTGPIRISIQYSQYAPQRLTGQGVAPPPPLPQHRPPHSAFADRAVVVGPMRPIGSEGVVAAQREDVFPRQC